MRHGGNMNIRTDVAKPLRVSEPPDTAPLQNLLEEKQYLKVCGQGMSLSPNLQNGLTSWPAS